MATKQVEEAPPGEILKYQTWVLKVLIHCDGCKKKVKKVLQGIEGVYTTEVDSRLHKVTVTGKVGAETLIKKLVRSGKFAELWPEIKPSEKKDNKSSKSKGGGDIIKENNEDQKNSEPVGGGGKSNEGCIDKELDKEDHSDECEEGGNRESGGGDEGGKKKKKKKKKNKSGNSDSAPHPPSNNGGGEEETSKVDAVPVPSSLASKDLIGPHVHQAYGPYPQMYYSPPPPPAYGLSYNTAYPIFNASYYVANPMMPMHAYNTAYPRLPPPPPPSNPIKHYGDDDEYEGGCSIM